MFLGSFSEMAAATKAFPNLPGGKTVIYCGVCSYPFEFCEYSTTFEQCKLWWVTHHPAYLADMLESLGLDDIDDAKSKVSKRAMQAARKKERKKESVKRAVLITRAQRNKRKYITVVSGLETLEITLKEAAKYLGKKFACGSAVSKTPEGGKEIVIQGDVSYDVAEALNKKYKVPAQVMFLFEKGKGKRRVELYED